MEQLEMVNVEAETLAAYRAVLANLDRDRHEIAVQRVPGDIIGMSFMFEGSRFVIEGADIEVPEEPCLYAMRHDCLGYESVDDNDDPNAVGYYTTEIAYGDFMSAFMSNGGQGLTGGRRFASNIPNVEDGTLIGFYWIMLSGIMHDLFQFES